MTVQVLATKLSFPPLRSRLVDRLRLFQTLEQGLDCGFGLISAPAGYGKSTLTSAWLSRTGIATTWLSLDDGDIRTAADGSQSGVCIFPDGSECDEWAYFRGECAAGAVQNTPQAAGTPTEAPDIAGDGCRIYRDLEFGYSFHYPADANIVTMTTPGMASPSLVR